MEQPDVTYVSISSIAFFYSDVITVIYIQFIILIVLWVGLIVLEMHYHICEMTWSLYYTTRSFPCKHCIESVYLYMKYVSNTISYVSCLL